MDPKIVVIRRYYEELFNQGRIDLVEELLHPEYINHSPGFPGLPLGRAGVKVVVVTLRDAFPDLRYTIEDLVVGDDTVAARVRLRGTHRGEFAGIAPTGRSVEVQQMTFERFRDGRIVAHHRLTDELSWMRQIGALP
jgi:steroid delta-isomerase-like uncharacterized protein